MLGHGALGEYALGEVPLLGTFYVLTAESGAFVIAGQAVTDPATLATITYAIAGQDVAFIVTRRLTVEAGAFVIAGQDAALLRARASRPRATAGGGVVARASAGGGSVARATSGGGSRARITTVDA